MQVFFCAGNSAKNRRSLAKGFFWLAIKMLRGGSVSIEVKDHEGSRESICRAELASLSWLIMGKRCP
ncbi:hypothetical protein CWN58_29905 [Klebsiella quasipneumoniae]|nr:hypothetical protein CWN58_29905 [Klebsiella quasipneumoniae]